MNLEPMRRLKSKLSVAFLAAAALVLASCGGGGATSSPNSVGGLQLLPGTSSLYAGVPYTFNIVGGRKPYLVTSSEPTLVELNFTTEGNQFTIVARNPGVVDVGLDPNEVPRRTVNIEVRDSNGASVSNPYNVLQNFFTGYSEFYQSTCAGGGAGTTAPQACSGTDSLVSLVPVSNGTLYGNREFQFDKVRGSFQFVEENPAVVPQLVDRIRIRTDHLGRGFVRLRVTGAAPTQLASYTITDVATGATTNAVFLIVQQPVVDTITVLPDTLTFTGTLTTRCGTGTADIFIFGGTPPYTVQASAGLAVSPTTVAASGDRVAVTVGLFPTPCPTGTSVIITDSRGAVTVVPVTIAAGSTALPAMTASPTTIASLACGASTTVTVIGGAGTLSASSTHPRITASILGNILTITRLSPDPVGPPFPLTGQINITDGAAILPITITATPGLC